VKSCALFPEQSSEKQVAIFYLSKEEKVANFECCSARWFSLRVCGFSPHQSLEIAAF